MQESERDRQTDTHADTETERSLEPSYIRMILLVSKVIMEAGPGCDYGPSQNKGLLLLW